MSFHIRNECGGIFRREKCEDKPLVAHLDDYASRECSREQMYAGHQSDFVKRRFVHLYDFAEWY